MFYTLKGNLRCESGNGFLRSAGLKACALLLALLLAPLAASAYTIVLKGGRRIEIPASFIVTPLTLTYEAAPGINVTLLISTVDIPATERANNEGPGSLLGRTARKVEDSAANSQSRPRRRELTQADIDKGRAERRRSEEAYERRRLELGLPSLEEARRRKEAENSWLREESQRNQAEVARAERYWRERAQELIADMAALDAQINYVRARLAEGPDYSSVGAYTFFSNSSPFLYPRRAANRFPVVVGNPGFMHGINQPLGQSAGFMAFGGTGQQGVGQFNAGLGRGNFGRRGRFGPGVRIPAGGFYGIPNAGYDYSLDPSNLIPRLRELEAARAGLQERWNQLEDEARRAGAQPGWLRP